MKGCGKCKWNLKSLFYQCTLQLIPLRLFRRLCDPIHLFWIFLSQLNLWSPLCKISKDWLTFFPKLFSVWSSMSLNNRTCNRHLFISSMLDALYSKYCCIHQNRIKIGVLSFDFLFCLIYLQTLRWNYDDAETRKSVPVSKLVCQHMTIKESKVISPCLIMIGILSSLALM